MSTRIRIFLVIIAVLPAIYNPLYASPIPRSATMPFKNSHFITIDSALIHYRIWGTKVSPAKGKVVFIHGFMGSTYCFRKNYDSLVNAGYNIIALDLPAFGYSDRGTWINHSQSSRAIMVWKLLDLIDMGDTMKWNIVGHSMGGGAAEAVALKRPGRTKSLTLIDAMFFVKNSGVISTALSPSKIKQLKKVYVDYIQDYMLTFNRMNKLLKSGYKQKPDTADVTGYMMPLRIPGTAEAIVSSFSNCKEVVSLNVDSLKKIPVLVVWGTKDSWIPLNSTKLIKTYVPQMELYKVKGAGHMPMETHPKEFNGILVDFLNRNNQQSEKLAK
ncbi:MAG: alpha/beta hydrolase [Bacteroidetes bacterium]|nr:alpha/beta hydrolase [Bacteroidota bacterium]